MLPFSTCGSMTHVCAVSVCGPGHLTSHDLLDTDTLAQMAQSSVTLFLNHRVMVMMM